MTPLLYAVLGLGLALGLFVAVGSLLPRTHRAASRIRLRHPPEMIWAVVRNLESVPGWWAEIRKSERLSDQVGQERYRQTLGNSVDMTLVVAESVPGRLLRTTIDAPPGAAFGGSWIYELKPAPEGTELRVTEEGWIGNPLFRVMARVMGYHRTLDSYLTALARRFGEPAIPEHVSSTTPG
jgi:uncharacterized protein YndB with AHSA1/START domain